MYDLAAKVNPKVNDNSSAEGMPPIGGSLVVVAVVSVEVSPSPA